MNVIINKEDKKVIWINHDSRKLSPTEILGSFDANTMQAVYCPGYIPKIEYIFRPTITGYNTIVAFEQKTVWNKTTLTPRQLMSWNDEIQETETTKEPIKDGDNYNIFQSFTGGKWVVDTAKEESYNKEQSNMKIISQIEALEKKIIRPMVAMAQNTSTTADVEKFLGLKSEIENLRNQLIKEEQK